MGIQKLNDIKEEILLFHKDKVLNLYKKGIGLGEICKKICLDIESILYILRKSKLKKKFLYKVYQEQSIREEEKKSMLITEEDNFYIEKFFPNSNTDFSTSYYWYWKRIYKKEQEKKEKCQHKIRTIRCSICNKILKDASEISLDSMTSMK